MGAEFKQRAEAQYSCIRRFMAATGHGPMEWAKMGYAVAFDRVWNAANEHIRKNHSVVYELTLATVEKVNKILG